MSVSAVSGSAPASKLVNSDNPLVISMAVSNADGSPISAGSTGVVRTFLLTAATSSGTVASGSKAVAFSSSSDFSGTITSAAFGASQAVGVSAEGADTIGAIAYTRSAGTLYIATLT